ncbi:hypothetical protein KKD72_02815 [Patescibacteria group bacterium]|nr:hypothetical protein [Patescibacteria group bacterium]
MEENNKKIPKVFSQALEEVKRDQREDDWSDHDHTDWGDNWDVWSDVV